jgi:hypothetical protein
MTVRRTSHAVSMRPSYPALAVDSTFLLLLFDGCGTLEASSDVLAPSRASRAVAFRRGWVAGGLACV